MCVPGRPAAHRHGPPGHCHREGVSVWVTLPNKERVSLYILPTGGREGASEGGRLACMARSVVREGTGHIAI